MAEGIDEIDGKILGAFVGLKVLEGFSDGTAEGFKLGWIEGILVGEVLGLIEGFLL